MLFSLVMGLGSKCARRSRRPAAWGGFGGGGWGGGGFGGGGFGVAAAALAAAALAAAGVDSVAAAPRGGGDMRILQPPADAVLDAAPTLPAADAAEDRGTHCGT